MKMPTIGPSRFYKVRGGRNVRTAQQIPATKSWCSVWRASIDLLQKSPSGCLKSMTKCGRGGASSEWAADVSEAARENILPGVFKPLGTILQEMVRLEICRGRRVVVVGSLLGTVER